MISQHFKMNLVNFVFSPL